MEDGILGDLASLYRWPKAIAVTGALGSGKTEFVLNLARGLKQNGKNVIIADADIINPYFCIRQITKTLEQEGFSILTPPEAAKWSDMSVINPSIGNALVGDSDHLLLDVGGDAGGVMALKQFEPDILSAGYKLLLIVNAWRPKTSTSALIVEMAERMRELCGLEVGALVCNSHLMENTTVADIASGLEIVSEAGRSMKLPVFYVTATREHYEEAKAAVKGPGIPLWPLTRFMKRPWEGAEMWS